MVNKTKVQIEQLRKKGLSNQEIADALGTSYKTVARYATELIREGKIKPRQRGPLVDVEQKTGFENQVLLLVKDGLSNSDIADSLGLSYGAVCRFTSKLKQAGKISDRRGGSGRIDLRLDSERVQSIIVLKRERATLKQIGEHLGVSTERARQLVDDIRQQYGGDVFESDYLELTTSEVAEMLQVPRDLVARLCADGEINARMKGGTAQGGWLILANEIERIRSHPRISKKKLCAVCGKTFKPRHNAAILCSDACRKQRRLGPYSSEKLIGWHKNLVQELKGKGTAGDESWLIHSEAVQVSGLTSEQVTILRRRGLVTVGEHPVLKWRGKPMYAFVSSEMEIAGRVYR